MKTLGQWVASGPQLIHTEYCILYIEPFVSALVSNVNMYFSGFESFSELY